MAEHDLFELAKLPFDFSENDIKEHDKVVAAIKKKVNELQGSINNNDPKRALYLEQKAFLEGLLNSAKNALGDVGQYERLKREKTNRVLETFKATLRGMPKKTVTGHYVKNFSVSTGLSERKVLDTLKDFGYDYVEFKMEMPKFPERTKLQAVEVELADLRKFGENNPSHSDLKQVSDMYALIAYIKGDVGDARDYRGMPHAELNNVLLQYSRDNSGHQAPPKDICARAAAAASKALFESEENKRSYDNHLLYNGQKMKELIARIKSTPEASLRESVTAENYLMEIEEIFPDENQALSIYNTAAGFGGGGKSSKEPYVRQIIKYHVKCGHCGEYLAFSTKEERDNAQNCRCSKPLYKQCRKCNKRVLETLDKCPHPGCEFVFASAAEFARLWAKADEFRLKGDFENARQFLARASSADPGEKAKVSNLEAKIAEDERIYREPINKLRKLIASKQFHAASSLLVQTINSFPMLNVTSFEAEIKSALARAQSSFDSAKNLNPSGKADICLDILNYCVDFQPAQQFLKTTAPMAVKGLSLSIDGTKNGILVSWARSAEKGVTYCVVRKTGKDAPKNNRDGELLGDGIGDTTYNDGGVSPGFYYSYAVFAKRMDVYSSPASTTVLFVADVTNVKHEQNGNTLRITWLLPKNSTGVSISRNQDGKEVVLTENAQTSFEDKSVVYGKPYSYTLRANYFGLPASKGVGFVVTIRPQIDRFQISVVQVKDNKYKVSWKIDRNDIDLRVFVGNTPVRDIKSDKKDCEIEVPKDGFHTVKVAGFSGGEWLLSKNSVEVNTYGLCEVDRKLSQIRENLITGAGKSISNIEFSIKIAGQIPSAAIAFWYAVRTKSAHNSGAPWADASEIGSAHDVIKIPVENYKERGEMLYTATAKDEDAYYVTLFTVYNVNGREVISSPFKRKFDRPLEARIVWSVTKPFLGILGKWKLQVEIKPNRAISGHPKLILCSSDGHLLSPDDARAFVVHEVAETVFDSLFDSYSKEYELDPSKISSNTKLFLFEKSSNENERYSLIWADGFSGKV